MDWPEAAEPSVPRQESSARLRVGQRQEICSLERYSYAVYLAQLIEPFESKLISKPPAKSWEVAFRRSPTSREPRFTRLEMLRYDCNLRGALSGVVYRYKRQCKWSVGIWTFS